MSENKIDEEMLKEATNEEGGANATEHVEETETAKETEVVEETEASETAEETEHNADGADEESKEKKGFFNKEKKKDKKDQMIEELTDKYKRTFAEFDNFRKRSEKEKVANYEIGAKSVIEKILPVVDNFERGFKAVPEEELDAPFVQGMDKIYKQLLKTLDDLGVKEIETEGKEFDPNFHNAVMHVEDDTLGENMIAEVLQKGYMYKDSVVRHSMVKVAN